MTRDEAKHRLGVISVAYLYDADYTEALNMAIDALKDRDGMIRAILDVLDSDDFPEDKCHRIELMLRGEVE